MLNSWRDGAFDAAVGGGAGPGPRPSRRLELSCLRIGTQKIQVKDTGHSFLYTYP